MSSIGTKLLCAIVASGEKSAIFDLSLTEELFRESEIDLYQFIRSHVLDHGVVPAPVTIEEKLGSILTDAPEPPEYYRDELGKRYMQTSLKKTMQEMSGHLTNQDPLSALQLMSQRAIELTIQAHGNKVVDYRKAKELIFKEYMRTLCDDGSDNMLFGFPTLDEMTGGLRGGDFCSIIGRPSAGKTFEMLYIAHNHWKQGGVPLFVSMEMNRVAITQRLTAMDTPVPMTRLLKAEITQSGLDKLWPHMAANAEKENAFWLIDGNLTTTVSDILMLCRQLQPSAVFVDGAYLLRHENQRLNRWDRMSENAELMKQKVATDLEIPVLGSYQFSREVAKKKKTKGDAITQDDVYGSDSIAQLSTICLGLLGAPSVEQETRREVSILKGRNGEVGKFLQNWNFLNMGFYEIDKDGKRVKSKAEQELDKENEEGYDGYEQEAFTMKFID